MYGSVFYFPTMSQNRDVFSPGYGESLIDSLAPPGKSVLHLKKLFAA